MDINIFWETEPSAVVTMESIGSKLASQFFHILDDHTETLRKQLQLQWQEHRFCDLLLQVKDGEFRVHACLAAAFSPTLNHLLSDQGQAAVSALYTITLLDFDYATMSPLVKLMYSGMIHMDCSKASSVAAAARFLSLPEMVCYNLEIFTRQAQSQSSSTIMSIQPPTKNEKLSQSDEMLGLSIERPSEGRGVEESLDTEKKNLKYVYVGPNKAIVSVLNKSLGDRNLRMTIRRKQRQLRKPSCMSKMDGYVSEASASEKARYTFLEKIPHSARLKGRRRKKSSKHHSRHQIPKKHAASPVQDLGLYTQSLRLPLDGEGGDGDEDDAEMDTQEDEESSNKVFWCSHCNIRYHRKSNLTRHMRVMHSQDYHLICKHCGKEVKSERELRVHCKVEHEDTKPFACDFLGCHYRTYKMDFLRRHQQIHKDCKEFVCDKCGRSFSQQAGLWSHRRTCYNTQEYLCDICGHSFNHYQSMKLHRRTVHLREKPYKCSDCGTLFSDHRNLRRHKRIHENAFPYSCDQCGNKYRHSNSLKAHLTKHAVLGDTVSLTPQTMVSVSMEMVRAAAGIEPGSLGGYYATGLCAPHGLVHGLSHSQMYSPPLLPSHDLVPSIPLDVSHSNPTSTPLETLADLCFSSTV